MTSPKRLRVALFSGNYNYLREGANQALNTLVGWLERRGHAVRVYSPVTATPAFEPTGTLIPVPSITLPVRTDFQLALGIPRSIRRDLERFAPDIVHVSTPDLLDLRAQAFAKARGIPIVASMHTRFEAYLAYYGLGWLRPLVEAHLHRFYRRADWVLAPTPALVDDVKRFRGDDRVSLFSRGVAHALFNPSRRDPAWRRAQGWADDDIVLMFFGRPVVEKGLEVFIAAVQQLQRERGNVRALVVGAGPHADRLRALDDVVLTGHLTGPDLARAVASADIMLHPSITETFGNVILEAMACGVPIVAADAPNARALIEAGHTGTLVPAADAAAYAAATGRLIDFPDKRRRMGAAASREAQTHTWEEVCAEVETAYFEVLGR